MDFNGYAEICQRKVIDWPGRETQPFGALKDESRESRRDWWALWVDRAPLSPPAPQLPSGLSTRPAALWNKGIHVFTNMLFRLCFSDLSDAPALTYSAGCICCGADTYLSCNLMGYGTEQRLCIINEGGSLLCLEIITQRMPIIIWQLSTRSVPRSFSLWPLYIFCNIL